MTIWVFIMTFWLMYKVKSLQLLINNTTDKHTTAFTLPALYSEGETASESQDAILVS